VSTAEHTGKQALTCNYASNGHCITCSDEAVLVRVVHVDETTQLAQVAVQGKIEEIDISLVDGLAPGAYVLVHGGVALERVAQEEEGER
jgi:Hydrogenase maturation factor